MIEGENLSFEGFGLAQLHELLFTAIAQAAEAHRLETMKQAWVAERRG